MANFNGTRDSNVALSVDNQNRKVLILDTITNFDDGVGNLESAEGVFDLGGTDSTSNPTNFNGYEKKDTSTYYLGKIINIFKDSDIIDNEEKDNYRRIYEKFKKNQEN